MNCHQCKGTLDKNASNYFCSKCDLFYQCINEKPEQYRKVWHFKKYLDGRISIILDKIPAPIAAVELEKELNSLAGPVPVRQVVNSLFEAKKLQSVNGLLWPTNRPLPKV